MNEIRSGYGSITPFDTIILGNLVDRSFINRRIEVLEFGCGVSTGIFLDNGCGVTIVDKYPIRADTFINHADIIISDSKTCREELLKRNKVWDMAFIDADHTYSNVLNDIHLAKKFVRKNGIIAGHDYDDTNWDKRYINEDFVNNKHHGVIKAVNEEFAEVKRTEGSTIWWAYNDRHIHNP